jgi:hypothetical protein
VLLRDSTEMLRRIDSQTVTDGFLVPEDEGATIFEASVTPTCQGYIPKRLQFSNDFFFWGGRVRNQIQALHPMYDVSDHGLPERLDAIPSPRRQGIWMAHGVTRRGV